MKIAIASIFLATAAAWAQEGFQAVCTNTTIQGDYGFIVTGMRPSAPGGPVEMIVGVAMTHFDGNGNLTQTDNIHGSITGLATPDRPGTGTYTVNSDCTGTMILTNKGAPPLTVKIVVVDNGNEIRAAVVSPTATVAPGTTPPQVMVTSNGRRTVARNSVFGE
jgi:hypothetical protein